MKQFFILLETENSGLYIKCDATGQIQRVPIIDNKLNLRHIFTNVSDEPTLRQLYAKFECKLVEVTKKSKNVLPELLLNDKISVLKLTINGIEVVNYGIKVANHFREFSLGREKAKPNKRGRVSKNK